MRCVYCHDDWHRGIRCKCGAVYHKDCRAELKQCATRGCSEIFKRSTFRKIFEVFLSGLRSSATQQYVDLERASIRASIEVLQDSSIFERINTALRNPTINNLNKII